MKLICEIKKVEMKKQGLDCLYEGRFLTDNPEMLELGKLPADTIVILEIQTEGEKKYGTKEHLN